MASSHAVTFSIHTPCSSSILVVVHVDGLVVLYILQFSLPYPCFSGPGQQAKLATLNRHTEGRRFQWTQSYPASQPGASYIFIYVPSVYEGDSNAWPTPYMLLLLYTNLQKFSQAK
jgi:hypothetical protein